MTVQTRRSIDLGDIIGLRFECKHCGASLELSFDRLEQGRMEDGGMDEKWVREITQRIREESASRNVKDEKFVEIQKLKREHGPGVWGDLRNWLKENCGEINAEMGKETIHFSTTSGNEITITGKASGMREAITVQWDSSRGTVEYRNQNHTVIRELEIAIDPDGRAGLAERGFPTVYTVEQIGKQIISQAVAR